MLSVESGQYCLRFNENKVDLNRLFIINIFLEIMTYTGNLLMMM